MMGKAFISLLVVLFASSALGQELGKGERKKRELEKVEGKKRVAKEVKCEFDSDCPEGQICDNLKKFCVRKSMSLVEFETANLSKQVEEMEAKKSELRRNTIKKMEELLATQASYGNRAEIYFRLAEAYWEESHYQYLKSRKVWMEAMDKFEEKLLPERPAEPKEDYSVSLEYYRRILREYQDYPRIDEVLYFLGRGALEAGGSNKDVQLQREGVKYLQSLEQSHPNSRLIPQALLHLGEHFFDSHQLYYAKTNYEKIINNYPNAGMYNYALYKLAWVYYNLTEFEKGLDTFHQVVDAIKKDDGKAKVEFREQALSDMILSYVEVDDGWERALEYYTKELDEKGAYEKLHTIGELYVASGKDKEALELYYHFIKKWPVSPRIPEYYQTILDIAQKQAVWQGIEDTVNEIMTYFKSESPWTLGNKEKNTEAVDQALKMVEELIFYVANHYHVDADKAEQKGQKGVSEPMYMKASEYYAEYLRRFPSSPRSYEINFWYAEILYFNLKDYKRASEQYQFVIEKDKKGQFVEDAALGVIYCQEELMAVAGLRERSAKGDVQVQKVSADQMREDAAAEVKETDLHPMEEDYIKAADKYTELLLEARKDPDFRKKYPTRGEMIPNIMYIAAETFYRHGKFGDAVSRFENIFKYDSKHKFAAIAATMIMDCYFRVRNWEKVEEWSRKLIAERNFLFKSKDELEMIIATAMTRLAQDYETEGKTSASIDQLKRLSTEFKNNKEIMAFTTYTLAYLYARSKKLREAIEKYEELIRTYPKSPKAAEAQFVIAEIYEAQTQFVKAAEAFMAMSKFKDNPVTPQAIINAATIYQALKDYDKTIKAFQTFLSLYPKHEWASRAFLKVADLEKEKGNLQGAYKQYIEFAKKYKDQGISVIEALAKAAAVLHDQDKEKNRKQVLGHCQNVLKLFEKLDEAGKKKARLYAAQAAFYTAQYAYYDFSVFAIDTGNFWRLSSTLEKKAKLHQEAEKLYEAVIKIQSRAWAAAAYYQIGLLYHEFAETLYAVPLPEGLSEAEVDAYKFELEQNYADPLEERARANFKQAILMAHKLGVYSQWSEKSGKMAAKLTPQDFPIDAEPLVITDKAKDTLMSTSFIRSLRRGDTEVDFVTIEAKSGSAPSETGSEEQEEKGPGQAPDAKEGDKPQGESGASAGQGK